MIDNLPPIMLRPPILHRQINEAYYIEAIERYGNQANIGDVILVNMREVNNNPNLYDIYTITKSVNNDYIRSHAQIIIEDYFNPWWRFGNLPEHFIPIAGGQQRQQRG